jgi:hypothetical protein
MPSLREVQESFAAALFGGDPQPAASLLRHDGIEPTERLAIYRNNLREGFRKTLALEFPVLQRLVGADYFRHLALAFQSAHPSRHGDLQHIGAPFPAWLRGRFGTTGYAYFADIAELEWAHEAVIVAPDSAPLRPAELAAVSPARYGELRFELALDCRLLQSPFPIVRIWQANQPQASDERVIDLGSGGDRLLVRRGRTHVEFHALDAANYAFLESLAAGLSLASALERALYVDPAFDVAAALGRSFALGVFALKESA